LVENLVGLPHRVVVDPPEAAGQTNAVTGQDRRSYLGRWDKSRKIYPEA
jgi:hypothetical protein